MKSAIEKIIDVRLKLKKTRMSIQYLREKSGLEYDEMKAALLKLAACQAIELLNGDPAGKSDQDMIDSNLANIPYIEIQFHEAPGAILPLFFEYEYNRLKGNDSKQQEFESLKKRLSDSYDTNNALRKKIRMNEDSSYFVLTERDDLRHLNKKQAEEIEQLKYQVKSFQKTEQDQDQVKQLQQQVDKLQKLNKELHAENKKLLDKITNMKEIQEPDAIPDKINISDSEAWGVQVKNNKYVYAFKRYDKVYSVSLGKVSNFSIEKSIEKIKNYKQKKKLFTNK